jgi:hypothetical protein
MKRRIILGIPLLLAIGWLFYLTACSLLDPVRARVDHFFADINGIDRTQVYLNFHPGILDMAGAQDPNTWEAQFPVAKIPYSISSLVTSDPSNVTLTVTSADLLKWNVLFVMEQLDSEWLISKMYKDVFPAAATTLIIE